MHLRRPALTVSTALAIASGQPFGWHCKGRIFGRHCEGWQTTYQLIGVATYWVPHLINACSKSSWVSLSRFIFFAFCSTGRTQPPNRFSAHPSRSVIEHDPDRAHFGLRMATLNMPPFDLRTFTEKLVLSQTPLACTYICSFGNIYTSSDLWINFE